MALIPELARMESIQKATDRVFELMPTRPMSLFASIYGSYFKARYYSKHYNARMSELRRLESCSEAEIREYENRRLKSMIMHCHRTVPYYRRLFRKCGTDPESIRTPRDLRRIPVLTREMVAGKSSELISRDAPTKKSRWVGTSGTTGTPLQVLWDQLSQEVEFAYVHTQWRWAGISIRDRRATLRGNIVVPVERRKPPYWLVNHAERQLLMSSFHLSLNSISDYVDTLSKFRPKAIQGYPSALYILATLMDDAGLSCKIPVAFTASEPLHDHYRKKIEEIFDCTILDMYGQTERVGMSAQCPEGEYHIFPGYGVIEVCEDDGAAPRHTGRVLGTGLNNLLMPLIRYDTGDIAEKVENSPTCSIGFPLLGRILTKQEDIIQTPDGSLISPSVLTHPFKTVSGIIRSQIVQESSKSLTVKLLIDGAFKNDSIEVIRSELVKRLGEGMIVSIRIVDQLPYSGRGKFKWIINEHAKKR